MKSNGAGRLSLLPPLQAGLASGDIIFSLDGMPVTGADDLIRMLAGDKIGRSVEVEDLSGELFGSGPVAAHRGKGGKVYCLAGHLIGLPGGA